MEGEKSENIEKESELLVYLVDYDSEVQETLNEELDQIETKIALRVFD